MGRLELRIANDVIDQIDEWRVDQPGRPSRSQAVRQLLDLALAAEKAKRPKK